MQDHHGYRSVSQSHSDGYSAAGLFQVGIYFIDLEHRDQGTRALET